MSSLLDPVSPAHYNSLGTQPTPDQIAEAAAIIARRQQVRSATRGDATRGAQGDDATATLTATLEDLTAELLDRLSAFPPIVRTLDAVTDAQQIASLSEREPVHPPQDDLDIARRVASDRRVFVLEHPLLPDRVLNVVWVALTTNVPRKIHEVIGASLPVIDPKLADTAVFYSIWNADESIAGLDAASALLTGAVGVLQAEFEHITTCITLSPIPGFRRWYETSQTTTRDSLGSNHVPEPARDIAAKCLQYLCTFDESGRLIDPVARFHLGNGARLYFLNEDADHSERGDQRSMGFMVNYRYAPEDLDANRLELQAGNVALGPSL